MADDVLGKTREDASLPLAECYIQAFEQISSDPKQELTVVEMEDEIVGTFQLPFLPYPSFKGGTRLLGRISACQVWFSRTRNRHLHVRLYQGKCQAERLLYDPAYEQ